MIRVAIVTDSPVLRAGLSSAIGAEGDIEIAAAEDADVAIVVARGGGRRDEMLAMSAAESANDLDGDRLHEHLHLRPTLVLLERMDNALARDAYAAGASAVLAIDARDEEIVISVRAIAAGFVVMQPSVSAELIAAAPQATDVVLPSTTPVSLTRREGEVLALLAQGLANKVIAVRLGITEHTVKTHIAAVYDKLNARNRAEAVGAAARQGLITF